MPRLPLSDNLRDKTKYACIAVVIAALAAAGFGAGARLTSPAPQGESAPPGQEVEALPLTLRPSGFEPEELTVPAGRYLLVVSNRTGLDGVGLRLDREAGGRLHDSPAQRRLGRWKQEVHLPPGTYVLAAADNPDWRCRVTVTPR